MKNNEVDKYNTTGTKCSMNRKLFHGRELQPYDSSMCRYQSMHDPLPQRRAARKKACLDSKCNYSAENDLEYISTYGPKPRRNPHTNTPNTHCMCCPSSFAEILVMSAKFTRVKD